MNIHEYQAQELLNRFDVPTPRGRAASTPEEAEAAAAWLGAEKMVVKAQVHAGGRGKGTFKNGLKGGVQLCKTPAQVRDIAGKMLGQVLVTKQTGADGRLVQKIMVAEAKEIGRELYVAILLDRARGCPMLLASIHGGMDIEAVAEEHPDSIVRETIHPALGIQSYQARKIAKQLGFPSAQMRPVCRLLEALYQAFIKLDCNLVEINPLVVTKSGDVLALDAKFGFDDNALFRHPEIVEMRDTNEEDPREVEASKIGLNYIGLDGDIGCMVNGAGLAMSTMDIIKFYGGNPANFLDVGGGADEEQVTGAFKILLADKRTKAVLVNIFGGIMKCDVIAQGIINAAKTVGMKVPLVVRLEGTNVEEGRRLLKESGLALQSATDLADAARKAVAAAKGA